MLLALLCCLHTCRPMCCASVTPWVPLVLLHMCGKWVELSHFWELLCAHATCGHGIGLEWAHWYMQLASAFKRIEHFNNAVWWLIIVGLSFHIIEYSGRLSTVTLIADHVLPVSPLIIHCDLCYCQSLPTTRLTIVMRSVIWFEQELSWYRCDVIRC